MTKNGCKLCGRRGWGSALVADLDMQAKIWHNLRVLFGNKGRLEAETNWEQTFGWTLLLHDNPSLR